MLLSCHISAFFVFKYVLWPLYSMKYPSCELFVYFWVFLSNMCISLTHFLPRRLCIVKTGTGEAALWRPTGRPWSFRCRQKKTCSFRSKPWVTEETAAAAALYGYLRCQVRLHVSSLNIVRADIWACTHRIKLLTLQYLDICSCLIHIILSVMSLCSSPSQAWTQGDTSVQTQARWPMFTE